MTPLQAQALADFASGFRDLVLAARSAGLDFPVELPVHITDDTSTLALEVTTGDDAGRIRGSL